ncbi:MAG: preprotein translocase subunit YajC [Gammaproteobacteria bacterium]|nr:preprotein translocase subunit YajC [Gammaproteobacteria bacterium]
MVDFFITNAYAQAASPQQGGGSFLVMMVIFFVIFYFMLMRPQMKQAKEHKKLIENLNKGDEVVTSGGLLGKISLIEENFIILEVASQTEVKVQKQSVTSLLPKGTIKEIK